MVNISQFNTDVILGISSKEWKKIQSATTNRDLEILKTIERHRVMRRDQLLKLIPSFSDLSQSVQIVNRRLRKLQSNGLIDKSVPIAGSILDDNYQSIITLNRAGFLMLGKSDGELEFRSSRDEYGNIIKNLPIDRKQWLALNDFEVGINWFSSTAPGCSLQSSLIHNEVDSLGILEDDISGKMLFTMKYGPGVRSVLAVTPSNESPDGIFRLLEAYSEWVNGIQGNSGATCISSWPTEPPLLTVVCPKLSIVDAKLAFALTHSREQGLNVCVVYGDSIVQHFTSWLCNGF